MTELVRIEVQNQFGEWRPFTTCANNPSSIKLQLRIALKSQRAGTSGKARAVDAKSGALIDLQYA